MRHPSLYSLRTRLLLLVLLAVVPSLGMALFAGLEQRRSNAIQAQKHALEVAQSIAADQEGLIEGTQLFLETLAQIPEVRDGDPATCSALLADLLPHHPLYRTLRAVKPNGDVYCSAVSIDEPVNVAHRPYFQRVLTTRGFVVGDYLVGRTSGRPSLPLAYPMLDDAGEVKGVVVAALDVAALNQLVAGTQLPLDSTLAVVDCLGTVLAHKPEAREGAAYLLPETSLLRKAASQRQGVTRAPGPGGRPYLFGFDSPGDSSGVGNLRVVVGFPEEMVFAAADRTLTLHLLGLGIAIALALLATWVGSDRFVLQQVRTLLGATRRLSTGDLTARVGLAEDRGELAELARAFDEMADSLEERTAQLREAKARYHTLVERIPAVVYTAALSQSRKPLYISPQIEPLLGFSPDEWLGDPDLWGQRLHDDDRERVLAEFARHRLGDGPIAVEYRLIARDGRVLWARDEAVVVSDEDGRPRYLRGLMLDITERKRLEDNLTQSRDFYLKLLEDFPNPIWRAGADAKCDYFNKAWLTLTGRTLEQEIGDGWTSGIHPEDRERCARTHLEAFQARRPFRIEYRLRAADGTYRWIGDHGRPFYDLEGGFAGYIGSCYDLTVHMEGEEAVRASEEKYRALAENSTDVILRFDREGRYLYANPAVEDVTGICPTAFLGKTHRELGFPEDLAQYWDTSIQRVFETGRPYEAQFAYERTGDTVWFNWKLSPEFAEDGSVSSVISTSRDVTEYKRQEQQLTYLATHDSLTGLPNRRVLEEALMGVIARVRETRAGQGVLLFLDVDHIKLVNDTLGHSAGDRVLITLAGLLKGCLREGDLLARVGGDEFAVLLGDSSVTEAHLLAERLRRAVDAFPFSQGHTDYHLGLSIGIVPVDGRVDPAGVLSHADVVMYRAKERGRNRIEISLLAEDDLAWSSETNRVVVQIKDALHANRFVLYYQPVVRLADGQIDHHEALIRLLDEGGEVLSPGAFIPVAERFGLMPELTRWVIERVISTLQEHPRVRIFVNLSGHCIADDDLLSFVEARLRELALEPGRLGFEITETTVVRDFEVASRWIERLRALGCVFALDDFGSGFSSFSYLRSLPVDELKIDGSLIRALEDDPAQRAIVQAIQILAHSLGKEVVAEFVENEAIARILKELGITYGQGYYLGKPSPELRDSSYHGNGRHHRRIDSRKRQNERLNGRSVRPHVDGSVGSYALTMPSRATVEARVAG